MPSSPANQTELTQRELLERRVQCFRDMGLDVGDLSTWGERICKPEDFLAEAPDGFTLLDAVLWVEQYDMFSYQDAHEEAIALGYIKPRPAPAPPVSKELRQQILERDGHRCQTCGSTKALQIDHIYPLSRGGSSEPENLQVLCRTCNLRKGSRVL